MMAANGSIVKAERVPDHEGTLYLRDKANGHIWAKVNIRRTDRYQIGSGYPELWPSKDLRWVYIAAIMDLDRRTFSDPIIGTNKEELAEKINDALGKMKATSIQGTVPCEKEEEKS